MPPSLISAFAILTTSSFTHQTECFILQVPTTLSSLQRRAPMLADKDSGYNDVLNSLPSLDQLSGTSSSNYGSSIATEDDTFFACDVIRQFDESLQTSTGMRSANENTVGISNGNTAVIRKLKIPGNIDKDYTTINNDDSRKKKNDKETVIENEFKKHGMPWKTSIEPTYNRPHLFYMPIWEMQKDFMKKHLTNLRPLPVTTRDGSRDLSYVEKKDGDKKVRMSTIAFTCDEFRKIRMTVYDAGNQTQAFTTLWYPQPHLGSLPFFGTNLLQFNQNRHLCSVDVQRLEHGDSNQGINTEDDCDENNLESSFNYEEEIFKPIRDRYPSLQDKMTNRFYDESQFFSNQMLLGRFEQDRNKDEESSKESNYEHAYGLVYNELMPAYEEYLESYLQMVQAAAKTESNNRRTSLIIDRQKQYDDYHVVRDPSHAMFKGQFGKQFADDYVHDVSFPYSDRKSE